MVLVVLLTTAYHSSNTPPAETIYAEQLVRVHKKLQQVSDDKFDPVSFIQPVQGNEARSGIYFLYILFFKRIFPGCQILLKTMAKEQ